MATISGPNDLAGSIGPRFHLLGWLPSVGFITGVWAISELAVIADPSIPGVMSQMADRGLIMASGALLLGIVVGLLTLPYQFAMIQFLEGYWTAKPLRPLARFLIGRQSQRLKRANAVGAAYPRGGLIHCDVGQTLRQLEHAFEARSESLTARLEGAGRRSSDLPPMSDERRKRIQAEVVTSDAQMSKIASLRGRLDAGATVRGAELERCSGRMTDADELIARFAHTDMARRRRLAWFPKGSRLLPTELGNTLRTAEIRAGRPYGADAMVAVPRLIHTMPKSLREEHDGHRSQLDMMVRLCFVFMGLAAIAVGAALVPGETNQNKALIGVSLVSLVAARIAYKGAVHAARGYGSMLEVIMDVSRDAMRTGFRQPESESLDEERKINKQVDRLLKSREADAHLSFESDGASQPQVIVHRFDSSGGPDGSVPTSSRI